VPHDQLSLAIGKRGQNARLASKLIGWNIDIRSDQEGQAPSGGAASEESPVEEAAPSEEGAPSESGGDELAESRMAPAGEEDAEPGKTAEPFGETDMRE
jgi:N utilization substance protein A